MSEAAYRISGLKQIYSGRLVLDVPDLEVEAGEILAVVGPSGSGKSTLLRLLDFLEPPSAGNIEFFGQRAGGPQDVELRRRIGLVFQRPQMLVGTLRDNVRFGQRIRAQDDPGRVAEVLKQVSLTELAEVSAIKLSGGEIQRAALARVLVNDPQVLLLDEPTANLDPANVKMIEQIIESRIRAAGLTSVLVTHNIHQARRLADRVAFLLDGSIVELSPVEQFFVQPTDPRVAAFISGEMIY